MAKKKSKPYSGDTIVDKIIDNTAEQTIKNSGPDIPETLIDLVDNVDSSSLFEGIGSLFDGL